MNWDNPRERARLVERLGPAGYEKALKAHVAESTLETINGYPIRPITTRFGRLFQVYGTRMAFRTRAEAQAYARNPSPG